MIEKLSPAPKGYIEHQGIKYAHFDEIEREYEALYTPEEEVVVGRNETIGFTTTLTNVRWRSDQGWTEPHDATITGEYTMHIPQEDE